MKQLAKLALLAMLVLLTGCRQELLQQVDQRQANEVLASLLHANISAVKKAEGKLGYSVWVDKSDFAAAVDILKVYDLPSKERVEIATMFPQDALVTSPRAEKARLFSAVEQRLEQSLLAFPSVIKARLHISYDVEDADMRQPDTPIHLSALITHEGDVDEAILINEVKRFLKNSLKNVSYDNTSVVVTRKPALQHVTPLTKPSDMSSPWLWGLLVMLIVAISGSAVMLWHRRKINNGVV